MEAERINARFIIEAQGTPKEHVEKNLKELIEKLKTLPGIEVYDVKSDEVKEHDNMFAGLADVGVYTKDTETLMSLVLGAGPSAVLILEPEKLTVTSRELQNIANDLSIILHNLAHANLNLRINNFMLEKLVKGNQPASPDDEPKKDPI